MRRVDTLRAASAAGINYSTQKENVGDRASTKADKLRKGKGWEAGILNDDGDKPKGMHWTTY